MEDRDQIRVLNAVRRATVEAPELGTRELHERVAERYPWVVGMDLRAFYSRFVRRAQKEAGLEPKRKKRTAASSSSRQRTKNRTAASAPSQQRQKPDRSTKSDRKKGDRRKTQRQRDGRSAEQRRARTRQAFVEFAQDVVEARSDSEIIEVIRQLDGYVDRVMATTSSPSPPRPRARPLSA